MLDDIDSPKNLFQICVLYQNDKPNGIAFSISPKDWPPGMLANEFTTKAIDDWITGMINEEGNADAAESYFRMQIEAIAQMKGAVPLHWAYLAAKNIVSLVQMGRLEQDEFNGFQFLFRKLA